MNPFEPLQDLGRESKGLGEERFLIVYHISSPVLFPVFYAYPIYGPSLLELFSLDLLIIYRSSKVILMLVLTVIYS